MLISHVNPELLARLPSPLLKYNYYINLNVGRFSSRSAWLSETISQISNN